MSLMLCLFIAALSPAADYTRLGVKADRENCLYDVGDTAVFNVECAESTGLVEYRLSYDGATTLEEGALDINGCKAVLKGSLDRPGFLRCDVVLTEGPDTARAAAACGFSVEAIRPTNVMPDDFDRFWREARAEVLRVPLDPEVEPADTVLAGGQVFRVSLAGVQGRIYGWLTLPSQGEPPYPAVLSVPGAGVTPTLINDVYARAGLAVLSINVHGIEPDREPQYYEHIQREVMGGWDYPEYGKKDPYRYYYRRVIQDCMRSLDYLCGRLDIDSSRVGIVGGSQGGFLSLMVTAIDKRIKATALNVPACCDHTGILHDRPSGWPFLLEDGADRERVLETCRYFDSALAAGLINVPVQMAVGFLDTGCAPTTVYSAFNNLKGSAEMLNFVDKGHNIGWPEWKEQAGPWIYEKLTKLKSSK